MERKHLSRLYFWLTAALCLLGTLLRAVCMLTRYDATIGYFDQGFLPTASYVLYFVAVVAAIVGALLLPKDSIHPTLHTPYRAPFAYAVGLTLVAFAAVSFASSRSALFTAAGVTELVLTLSALAATVYFPLTALRHGQYRDGLVFVGFLPLLWCMSAIAVTYSDPFVTMNSPIKVSLQMGLLGFMLILVAELGCRLGKPVSRKAIALTGIGTYLALNASLPLLVTASVSPDLVYTLCAVVLLAVGLYGGYMLFCYGYGPADQACTAEAESEKEAEADSETEVEAEADSEAEVEAEADTTSDIPSDPNV